MQKVERVWHDGETAFAMSDNAWFPDLSWRWIGQVHLMGVALRYACHRDAATAAWETIYNAQRSLGATPRLGGGDAATALDRAVRAFLDNPALNHEAFVAMFPAPVTPDARDELLDRERQHYDQLRREWNEVWGDRGSGYGPIEPLALPR